MFEHLRATVRTVLDYDRFETGQLVPRHERFLLADSAVEILEELRRHAVMADKTVTLARPRSSGRSTATASCSRPPC